MPVKLLLSVFISVCLIGATYAQKGLHVGVSGAFNASFLTEPVGSSHCYDLFKKFTPKYSTGLTLAYQFNEMIGVQTEVRYTRLGQNYDVEYLYPIGENLRIDLQYISIPMLFRVTTKGPKARMYFLAGPQVNFYQHGTYTYIDRGINSVLIQKHNIDGEQQVMKKIELGLVTELGGEFSLGKHWYLNTGIRFYTSLTEIDDPNEISGCPHSEKRSDHTRAVSRNISIGINVGVKYVFMAKK